MNVQIFGKIKCQDTKKADRYFKERKIKFQYIELEVKGLSKRELLSVLANFKSPDDIIDEKSKAYQCGDYNKLRTIEGKINTILDNPMIIKSPIVRNGKLATVGNCPEVWKTWLNTETIT